MGKLYDQLSIELFVLVTTDGAKRIKVIHSTVGCKKYKMMHAFNKESLRNMACIFSHV